MPETRRGRSAPAFVASCAFGALGAVLLVSGLLSGAESLVVVATALGSLSLVSALVWRGQLISKWRADRYERSGSSPDGGGPVRSPSAPPR